MAKPTSDDAVAVSADALRLELANLERRFGRRRVFEAVTASVSVGQVLTISGSNGSGKSTLLRVVAGLLAPTSGEVRLISGGALVEGVARRRMMGYVAPDFALYARLTATENLRFLATLYGIGAFDPEALLERVGLARRGDDAVGSYSSGMRQRLKYAAALLHRPPVLLLDEPTANLDAAGAAIVEAVVAEQRTWGITVVATNEANEVTWGDHVVWLGR